MALRKSFSDPGRLRSVKQIAELAGVSESSIRRAIDATGPTALAYIRIGGQIRISDEQYLDWLRRNTQDARL